MKKFLSVLLSLIMITMSVFGAVPAFAEDAALASEGECGESAVYTFNSDTGELVISGSGIVDSKTFQSKQQIKTVSIENGITEIGNLIFTCCENITSVTMADSVTKLGGGVFEGCTSMESIELSNNLTSISFELFHSCKSLKNITIPESVTEISQLSFYNCVSLTDIVIPDSVTEIVIHAFANCTALTEIIIPESVANIGQGAFEGCSNLGKITIENANCTFYEGEDGVVPTSTVIYGHSGSTAQSYAEKFDNPFVSLDGEHIHTWDDGVVTKAATTSAAGVKTYTCTGCGETKTEAIAKIASAALNTTATYYTGTVKTPTVTVKDSAGKTLVNGTDYTVTMDAGRINVGRYAVKITYKGDYSGTQTLYFNIIPKGTDVSGVTVRATGFTVQWNTQKTQTTGYQVQYSKNSNFTSATTINMPKPDYYAKAVSGLAKNTKYYVRVRTYTVTKFNGANYNIYSPWTAVKTVYTVTTTASLNTTATYYTGTVKTPTVTVKDSTGRVLKNGTDYTVTQASGRKNVGRYAVKITYKGTYEGVPAQTLYFNIIPRGITGITKVTASSKGFTVQWNTQKTATTGYQIQYSTSSNFANAKTITMPKNAYYAKKVTGLASNKKYYVRVRTYTTTTFNGANYNIYSPWCAVKTVTTK